ncbi:MAG TPA: hypothetical protein VE981_07510 [Planctomycetota bacterium]|nr:hypothetical protein [Planctomycetota bacterium]
MNARSQHQKNPAAGTCRSSWGLAVLLLPFGLTLLTLTLSQLAGAFLSMSSTWLIRK